MAAYIKFDGIDGEVADKSHQKWTEILSYSQGMSKPGGSSTGVSRGRGDVIVEDIHCSKLIDLSSMKIATAVLSGKVFPKVVIHLTASYSNKGRVTYLEIEMKKVHVVNYQCGGSGQSEEPPAEQFSLNYEEIKVTYSAYKDSGEKGDNDEYTWKVAKAEA